MINPQSFPTRFKMVRCLKMQLAHWLDHQSSATSATSASWAVGTAAAAAGVAGTVVEIAWQFASAGIEIHRFMVNGIPIMTNREASRKISSN